MESGFDVLKLLLKLKLWLFLERRFNGFNGFARICFIEIEVEIEVEIVIEIAIEINIEIETAISYKTSYDLDIAKLYEAAWVARFFCF